MPAVETRNIVIRQGSDFEDYCPFPSAAEGQTVRAEIRHYPGGPLLARLAASVLVELGEIKIALPAAESALLKRSGVFDVEVESESGAVTAAWSGKAIVLPEVTKEPSPSARKTCGELRYGHVTCGDLRTKRLGAI